MPDRDDHVNGEPFGTGFKPEGTAQSAGPVRHGAEADPRAHSLRRQPIVTDAEVECGIGKAERGLHPFRLTVAMGVGQGLLEDTVEVLDALGIGAKTLKTVSRDTDLNVGRY